MELKKSVIVVIELLNPGCEIIKTFEELSSFRNELKLFNCADKIITAR